MNNFTITNWVWCPDDNPYSKSNRKYLKGLRFDKSKNDGNRIPRKIKKAIKKAKTVKTSGARSLIGKAEWTMKRVNVTLELLPSGWKRV